MEEARALMTEALTGVDRASLLAERAEAEAQLRAAQATLGIPPPASPAPHSPAATAAAGNGRAAPGEDRGGATPNSDDMDQIAGQDAPELEVAELEVAELEVAELEVEALDVEALRQAAAAARAADDALARAASEAAGRPLPSEPVAEQMGTAESALARALEIQEDLPAAWRRLVGALISATGMAIVIGALGWNVYWLLVPIALIAIMTVDLRVAGQAAREASVEAARELASVGVTGADGLDRIRSERARIEEAEARLAAARAGRDAAYARFEELAPGHLPSDVDDIAAEYEAAVAARAEAQAARAEAQAAQAAWAKAEAEAARAEAGQAKVEPASAQPVPAMAPAQPAVEAPPTAAQWWFGSQEAPAPPPAAAAPVRALAERLSAEGREALARIQAQLEALDRVELAKRSLEWHEARRAPEESD